MAIKTLQSKNKQWYFVVTAKNNKVLVTSETYKTKAGVANGIKALRKALRQQDMIAGYVNVSKKMLQDFKTI